jgi:hypothetical protein
VRREVVTVARAGWVGDVHEDIVGLVNIVLSKVDADGKNEVFLVRSTFVERREFRTSPMGREDVTLLMYRVLEETPGVLRSS